MKKMKIRILKYEEMTAKADKLKQKAARIFNVDIDLINSNSHKRELGYIRAIINKLLLDEFYVRGKNDHNDRTMLALTDFGSIWSGKNGAAKHDRVLNYKKIFDNNYKYDDFKKMYFEMKCII